MTLKQQRILGKIRSEIAIEELQEGYLLSIFKSSLFHNRRSKECNHGKQDANRAVFHNRREYFIEVHTLSLTIALWQPSVRGIIDSKATLLKAFETISNRVLAETAETRVLMPAVLLHVVRTLPGVMEYIDRGICYPNSHDIHRLCQEQQAIQTLR